MVINQEFVEKVLSRTKDLFKFDGYIKYYPGRELAEAKSLVFMKNKLFMDYLWRHVPWEAEYYVVCQSKREVSFRLNEELMQFQMDTSGKFKLVDYIDRGYDKAKPPIKMNIDQLNRELQRMLVEALSPPKGRKKSA